jgi:hypothetical protein
MVLRPRIRRHLKAQRMMAMRMMAMLMMMVMVVMFADKVEMMRDSVDV